MDTDKAWLAGIMDGEGCISLGKRSSGGSYRPRIDIVSTSDILIQKVQLILGSLDIPRIDWRRPGNRNPLSRLPVQCITLQGAKSVVPFLEAVLPFLTEKRAFAEAIVAFYKARPKAWARWSDEEFRTAKEIRRQFMPRAKHEE